MIFVDTTVLVYAVGAQHSLRASCQGIVEAIEVGELRATTTSEVVQEFAHVRARRRTRSDAVQLATSYAALFAPLVSVDEDDLAEGLVLFEQTDRLGAFDCVLAATARRREADALVSADQAFATVPGLRYLDPAAPDFREALAGVSERG